MEPRELIEQLLRAGQTQAQIAAATGVAQSTISKLLRGGVSDMLSKGYRRLVEFHRRVVCMPAPSSHSVGASVDREGERRAA